MLHRVLTRFQKKIWVKISRFINVHGLKRILKYVCYVLVPVIIIITLKQSQLPMSVYNMMSPCLNRSTFLVKS